MVQDFYHTIKNKAEGSYKEKGSKFFAYAFGILSKEDFEAKLLEIKKLHFKARHHCFAYKIQGADNKKDSAVFRYSDDGEPSGTAGKPIFGQLEKNEISNTCIIVVRYFGGTKLGTSGLIRSYKLAAADALAQAGKKIIYLYDDIALTCPMEMMGPLMNAIAKSGLEIASQDYQQNCQMVLRARKSESSTKILKLKSLILDKPLKEIDDIEWPDGMAVKY